MNIVRIIKKYNLILSKHQRFRLFELGVLMIIGGFLEVFSVSIILPFVTTMTSIDSIMENQYVRAICDVLSIDSSRDFLLILSITIAILYLVKNIFLIFENNVQYTFVFRNMFALRQKMLQSIINRPYEYFLMSSSPEIVRVINTDISSAFLLLITILSMVTELIVSLMLVGTIFIISPLITLCITAILLGVMLCTFFIIKPILKREGINQMMAGTGMNKWILQAVNGIKEVKVMGKEKFFQDNYNKWGGMYVNSNRWNQTLSVTPRYIIESVFMGGIFIVVAFLIYRGADVYSLIPILTSIAMAAVRLLPSANKISNALSQIEYGEPVVDKVIENLKLIDDKYEIENGRVNKENEMIFNKDIVLNNITYRYPQSDEDVLESANMYIKKGESIGIVGSSGAGKSTVADILLGLLRPQKGQVLVDGVDINDNIAGWLSQIGYIPQSIFMLDDTIRANVVFGDKSLEEAEKNIWMALKEAAIDDFVIGLLQGLDTEIGERGVRLSGGQIQRIGIARALYRNPQILVFDEATSALDYETENAIMESINHLQGKKTMLIIAHRLSTVEKCDHIYRVENGKITKER